MEEKFAIVTQNKSVYFVKWAKPLLGKPKVTMDFKGNDVEIQAIGKGDVADLAQAALKHNLSPDDLKEGNIVLFSTGSKKIPEFHKTSPIKEVYQKKPN
jgi:hypothetical protein